MKFCTQCGHELGIGRFCTNCGYPVPGASVEPPAQPVEQPVEPPAQAPAPPAVHPLEAGESNSRYPLFADEVPAAHTQLRPDHAPYQPPPVDPGPPGDIGWAPTPGYVPPPMSYEPSEQATVHRQSHQQERRGGIGSGWLIFAASMLCLLLIGGFAVWLLSGGDDDKKQDVSSEPTGDGSSPTDKESPGSDAPPGDPENPTNIARYATAVAPATAPPGQDLKGQTVRFDASNMLDGQPETAWRMKGDGSSQVLTFDLDQESVITSVGLINGYAKTDRDPSGKKTNWYVRNRKITQVEWIFDDGTKVAQTLSSSMSMQRIDVDDVTTESIQLRIVSISPPPEAQRDYTVISDVSLIGAPPA